MPRRAKAYYMDKVRALSNTTSSLEMAVVKDFLFRISGRGFPALEKYPNIVGDNKDIVLANIRAYCAHSVGSASDRLRDDYEVGMAAVLQNGGAIRHLSDRLKSDPEIARAAVRNSPAAALQYVTHEISDDAELIASVIEDSP